MVTEQATNAFQIVANEAARTVGAHYAAKGRAAGATDTQIQDAISANWSRIQGEIAEVAAAAWSALRG